MENKYITVAYKLYTLTDGKKELLEEAPADHPFQFISGIGYTLDRFEKEITALEKEATSASPSRARKHTANAMKTTYVRFPRACSTEQTENSTAKTFSRATSLC